MTKCNNCGSDVADGLNFCPTCGAKQEVASPQVQGERSAESKNGEAETALGEKSQKTEAEKQKETKPLAKKYKHLKVANIIAWVLFVLSAGSAVTFVFLWQDEMSEHWLINRRNTVICEAFDIPSYGPYVVIDKVYNHANGSTDLDHTKITYLEFSYHYYYGSASEKLYVKIIQPDGVLSRNPSISPAGYTLSCDATSSSINWGSDTPGSIYYKGRYTIEFWYKNSLVGRKIVQIF